MGGKSRKELLLHLQLCAQVCGGLEESIACHCSLCCFHFSWSEDFYLRMTDTSYWYSDFSVWWIFLEND